MGAGISLPRCPRREEAGGARHLGSGEASRGRAFPLVARQLAQGSGDGNCHAWHGGCRAWRAGCTPELPRHRGGLDRAAEAMSPRRPLPTLTATEAVQSGLEDDITVEEAG